MYDRVCRHYFQYKRGHVFDFRMNLEPEFLNCQFLSAVADCSTYISSCRLRPGLRWDFLSRHFRLCESSTVSQTGCCELYNTRHVIPGVVPPAQVGRKSEFIVHAKEIAS